MMMRTRLPFIVTPAEAGVSVGSCCNLVSSPLETPASAGVTEKGEGRP
jgi:hypothetical protein